MIRRPSVFAVPFDVQYTDPYVGDAADIITAGDPPKPREDPRGYPYSASPPDPTESSAWEATVASIRIVRTMLDVQLAVVHPSEYQTQLEARVMMPDTKTGEPTWVSFRVPAPSGLGEVGRLAHVYSLLRWVMLHELQECFMVNGQQVLKRLVDEDHGLAPRPPTS